MTDPRPIAERHEEQVLGAALTHATLVDEIGDTITGPDFHEPRHERIWDAIRDLHADGDPINPVSVADTLSKTGDLAKVGGSAYLFSLVSDASPASATWHAARVREGALVRRIAMIGARISQRANDPTAGEDALALVEAARGEIDQLTAADVGSHVGVATAVYDAIGSLDEPAGLPTPWPALTDVLAGMKPGCVYVIGARPAVGKSVMAQAMVVDAARRGKAGIMFSLEMSRNELMLRVLSSIGKVNMGKIQGRHLSNDDYGVLAQAAKKVTEMDPLLVVDDRSWLTVAQMRAKTRQVQRQHEVGVVVIDYMQLIQPPAGSKRADRREQVDAISRSLKLMAKDLRVPVVVLAQLNRGLESRVDKKPAMSDLRESGAIEQDADVVMLMHREGGGDELDLLVAKNRHGPTKEIRLTFRGWYSSIDDSGFHNG